MNDVVLFKNPHMRFRTEKFGGIIKTDKGIFILGKEEYREFRDMPKFYIYSDTKNNKSNLIKSLLDIGALIKIKKERANKVLRKVKNGKLQK